MIFLQFLIKQFGAKMYSLIIGIPSDPVIQHFFKQKKVFKDPRLLFINTSRLGQDIHINRQGWILPCGGYIQHSEVGAVYNRMLSTSGQSGMVHYLHWLLDDCYPKVINRPKDTMTNFSKIWQLGVAHSLGCHIPKTMILANAPSRSVPNGSIFKSISSVRSIVHAVSDHKQDQVHEPVVFQEDLGRINVRVHCLGSKMFAQKIVSNEVDYRYGSKPKITEHQLPKKLEQQCVMLARKMNLIFSGIDFMYHKGRYVFLEINPSPGYAYFEQHMEGSPISKALHHYLRPQ